MEDHLLTGVLKDDRSKASNPKDAVGTGKVPFSTVPAPVIAEIGLGLLEGARKYGRHNYRAIGVRFSVYYDAALRHLTAWWEGQDIDPDSGLNHITKALATLTVLRDAMINNKFNDDRPPKNLNQDWVVELNKKAKEINERYPNAVDPYTQKSMEAPRDPGEEIVAAARKILNDLPKQAQPGNDHYGAKFAPDEYNKIKPY